MLNELCGYLRNWFDRDKYIGHFQILNGAIIAPEGMEMSLLDGQYIRIVGSLLNDGVYQYSDNIEGLTDEEFDGAVWSLAIPKEVVAISEEIKTWVAQYGGASSAAMSPFSSESFDGYSYSKGGASGNSNASAGDWKSVFASRLDQWRKI